MLKRYLSTLILVLITSFTFGQNTVGNISITEGVYDGFTLFSIHKKTYLINNCGQIINEWTSEFTPGNAVYLLENGNILRTGKENGLSTINFGGVGGIVEIFDWEGNLLWQYRYNNNSNRQHHDVYPLPNGNVLILAATVMSNSEAIDNGRDPSLLVDNLYNEQIIEVMPIGANGANVIWEWNVKDHLIQDFDALKDNFGNVGDNPQKLDINFLNGNDPAANWLHVNSIQYDNDLDQIIISSRNLSEFWIIDHSTSTVQAASNFGGTYGKGGDFLYRWGNPQSYKRGTVDNRKLFGQHYPHYIRNTGTSYDDKIIIFNNGIDRSPSFSEVNILTPPTTTPGFYSLVTSQPYGPDTLDYFYNESNGSNDSDFYSSIVSSAQVLPNGNILVCQGAQGYFFELDQNNNKVWEYINPVMNGTGTISAQGDEAPLGNTTFRAIKYRNDYAAFVGRDLTPQDPIETNFNLTPCEQLNVQSFNLKEVNVFPNPVSEVINFSIDVDKVELFNLIGEKINTVYNENKMDVSNLKTGLYLIKLFKNSKTEVRKIIKL